MVEGKTKKVHYHRLPLANKPLPNVWLSKMKLARPPKLEHARICSDHFTTQAYESRGTFDDSGRFLMKQTSTLKATAVPTLFDFSGYSQGNTDAPSRSTPIVSDRAHRLATRLQQKEEQQFVRQLYQVITFTQWPNLDNQTIKSFKDWVMVLWVSIRNFQLTWTIAKTLYFVGGWVRYDWLPSLKIKDLITAFRSLMPLRWYVDVW